MFCMSIINNIELFVFRNNGKYYYSRVFKFFFLSIFVNFFCADYFLLSILMWERCLTIKGVPETESHVRDLNMYLIYKEMAK